MFLRSTNRKKDGKEHRYFSIVENRRLPGDKTVQRTVLYLGEINDQQKAEWRKTLDVFDEQEQRYTTMSLFPDDRAIPADVVDSLQVRLSGLELRRPRIFGNCWLACELWHQLGLCKWCAMVVLHTLFYANEVRAEEEPQSDPGLVAAKELELAKLFVRAFAA